MDTLQWMELITLSGGFFFSVGFSQMIFHPINKAMLRMTGLGLLTYCVGIVISILIK